MTCLTNVKLYDFLNFFEDAYIVFGERILEVGKMDDFDESIEHIDMEGKLVIPGLINCHTHIYSTLFRGLDMKVEPSDFKAVLDEIWWRFDSKLTLEDVKYSAEVYVLESYLNGVTALIDHHASGEIEGSITTLDEVLNDLGMKHLLSFETSDRFDVNACVSENRLALDLGGHFGLHASLSLSNRTLSEVYEYLGSNPIHIHVAEGKIDEIESKKIYGKSVVKRLKDKHLLNEDSILAHCLHIDDEEAKLIAESGSYIALNPTSNLNNAVGIYDYNRLRKYDIPVIVGTDGLGSSIVKEYQLLYYAGKMGLMHPSGVDFNWIKEVILEGYRYFYKRTGLKMGRFEKGYSADFCVVDYDAPTPMNKTNIFGHLFFGVFEHFKPRHVYSSGKQVVKNYTSTLDIVCSPERAKNLWNRIEVSE